MSTVAEFYTRVWRTEACTVSFCAQPAGRRCINQAGVRVPPHPARRDAAAVTLADENAGLLQELGVANDTVTRLTDGLQEQAGKVTALVAERDGLQTQIKGLADSLTKSDADLRAALTRIAELEKPDPTPEPQPTKTLPFGVGVDQLGNLETVAGKPVGYHRTYWTLPASGIHTGAVAQAKADLVAGRTPVMSFKLPSGVTWAQAATGKADGPLLDTFQALADLDGVAIAAVHHEPEGDGTLADYRAMTSHCVAATTAANLSGSGRLQFWQCFTGYHQLYGSSEWKLDKVHVPGVDGIGFDPYLSYGASSSKWTDQTASYYKAFGAFAAKVGCQWGIWETGINEQAITSGLPQAKTFIADCVAGAEANGAAMWIYFNSETTKDGVHDWRLTTSGANKLNQMAAAVVKYAR